MKFVSDSQIINSYRNGERNFTNIECKGGNFSGIDMRGVIFANSNLSGASFSGANLDDSDFNGCILLWSNFDHASLRRTNFSHADLSWMKATEPIFEKTNFTNANLNWAYIFKADMSRADFTDAHVETMATKFSEVHEVGLIHGEESLAGVQLPPGVSVRIKHGIDKMRERWKRFDGSDETALNDEKTESKSEYSTKPMPRTETISYGRNEPVYTKKTAYGQKRKGVY